jgi:hypothetical protein
MSVKATRRRPRETAIVPMIRLLKRRSAVGAGDAMRSTPPSAMS